jgi:hypothetical protein
MARRFDLGTRLPSVCPSMLLLRTANPRRRQPRPGKIDVDADVSSRDGVEQTQPLGVVNGQRDFPVGGQLISLLADR